MDDDELLADLRTVLQNGAADRVPVEAEEDLPPGLLASLQAAYTWRRVDEELAELLADEPVGVRGSGGAAVLSFDSGAVAVDVQVVADGRLRTLVGQVDPPHVRQVRLERPDAEPIVAEVDAHGRFRVPGVPTGPVRVVVIPAAGASVIATDWITA
jgi:hypothetical protein